jgi:hypothetical protein
MRSERLDEWMNRIRFGDCWPTLMHRNDVRPNALRIRADLAAAFSMVQPTKVGVTNGT